MKRWLFLLFLVIFSVFVSARNIDLIIGYNYVIEDRNISLVRTLEDKVVICVNGEKSVVSEDIPKYVNDVRVNLIRVRNNIATFDFSYNCRDECFCEEGCDNSGCFGIEEEVTENNLDIVTEDMEEVKEEPVLIKKEEVISNSGISSLGIIVAILVTIVLILGVIVLWRRF